MYKNSHKPHPQPFSEGEGSRKPKFEKSRFKLGWRKVPRLGDLGGNQGNAHFVLRFSINIKLNLCY